MNIDKIVHVYFMPGLAANAEIFENIKLPENQFKSHYLEWEIPKKNETIREYAQRMNKNIFHQEAVLIGVSFGGVVVQEMSNYLNLKRLIIISSVKCKDELPRRMKFASKTGFYKLLPLRLLDYVDHFEKFAVNDFLKKRARLYRKYLSVRDRTYLAWAIKNMVNWDCVEPRKDLIHIHGDSDEIFPIKYIGECIPVKGGTHIMIINKFQWFNKNLPKLIMEGNLKEY